MSFTVLAATTANPDDKTLSDFLVDTGATTVSAANFVGINATAVQDIQSTQDLVMLIRPFASTANTTGAYGLAVSPARTSFSPISGQSYYRSDVVRLFASTRLSYAENRTTVGSVNYRKMGYAVDFTFSINRNDDPIHRAYHGFNNCEARSTIDRERFELNRDSRNAAERELKLDLGTRNSKEIEAALKANVEEQRSANPTDALALTKLSNARESLASFQAAQTTLAEKLAASEKAHVKCVDDKVKSTPWNAPKISLAFGAGRLQPLQGNGPSYSLGRSASANAVFGFSDHSAFNLSLLRKFGEIDEASLATTPSYNSKTLGALRYTYAGNDKSKWRGLAEISNAKASSGGASEKLFKHAVGLDYRLISGMWLEFRVGRSVSASGTGTQTTSLLTLNFSPSSTLAAMLQKE